MHTSLRAALLLTSLLAATPLVHPGRASAATEAAHPTKLTVTTTQIGPGSLRVVQTYRVRCAPRTGSTVPRPVETCRALAVDPRLLRPAPAASGPCPVPRYWVDITGVRDKRTVKVSFRSCVGVQGQMVKAWLRLLR